MLVMLLSAIVIYEWLRARVAEIGRIIKQSVQSLQSLWFKPPPPAPPPPAQQQQQQQHRQQQQQPGADGPGDQPASSETSSDLSVAWVSGTGDKWHTERECRGLREAFKVRRVTPCLVCARAFAAAQYAREFAAAQ